VDIAEPSSTLRLIGGPTTLITYGGLRLLTDPTFDPPGEYPRPGSTVVLPKLRGPAVRPTSWHRSTRSCSHTSTTPTTSIGPGAVSWIASPAC
jgi:hypothetical protein